MIAMDRLAQSVVARFRRSAKPADRLPSALRTKINQDLNRSGLDGNFSFRSVGEGLGRIGDVLSRHGLEWDDSMNAHRFLQDEGTAMIDVAFSNPEDSFSPISISNTAVRIGWYKRESGTFEVTAYLS